MYKNIFNSKTICLFKKNVNLLSNILPTSQIINLCGIERENLRTDYSGYIAKTPHPIKFGSALTHPEITTDYSESLIELVTPPMSNLFQVFNKIQELHYFITQNIDKELLWPMSMPSKLPLDNQIPIAYYGNSNQGKYKKIYRSGLGLRYGRTMQCIAGVHFNYSINDFLWKNLYNLDSANTPLKTIRSLGYLNLIRNFEYFSWLLLYLFGASPILHPSFLQGKNPKFLGLIQYDDDTLVAPYATSLRMSELGYKTNFFQKWCKIKFDNLNNYIKSIETAISQPHLPYKQFGIRDVNGNWLQLNDHLFQIESELYSKIRPKQKIQSGERLLTALAYRGIGYVEVRVLDLNPFEKLGISMTTSYFIEVFLIFCALIPSLPIDTQLINEKNFNYVAKQGRQPNLVLEYYDNNNIKLRDWGLLLLDLIVIIAEHLDKGKKNNFYQNAVAQQLTKLNDVRLTPSAQILSKINEEKYSFIEFGITQAHRFTSFLMEQKLNSSAYNRLLELSKRSLITQIELEDTTSKLTFEDYIYNKLTV